MAPYYESGGVAIYHGEALEILPTIARASVDLVVTDPPYIIGAVSAGTLGSKSGGWADMMNSALWFSTWYRMVDRLLHRTGAMWTFCNWRTVPVVMRAATDAGLPLTSMMVWDKEWIGPGGVQGLRPSYELCALMAKDEFAITDRGVSDIWRCQVGSYKATGHPAEKPLPLVSRLIRTSCVDRVSPLIVDPFLGSGTTAVAAHNLQMRCIGIEAEERWCEMAAKRLAQGVMDFGGAA